MKLFTREQDAPATVPIATFNEVAQLGHFAGGAAVVFGVTLLVIVHKDPVILALATKALWIAFVALLVAVGVKEAFIDPRTESKIVAGSGLEDWALWMIGASFATLLIYLVAKFGG